MLMKSMVALCTELSYGWNVRSVQGDCRDHKQSRALRDMNADKFSSRASRPYRCLIADAMRCFEFRFHTRVGGCNNDRRCYEGSTADSCAPEKFHIRAMRSRRGRLWPACLQCPSSAPVIRRIQQGMEDSQLVDAAHDTIDFVVVKLTAAVEANLITQGHDPFSWASVTITAPLHVAEAESETFYIDANGRDYVLSFGFDADLVAAGRALDVDAVGIFVRVANTLESVGEYTLDVELGYRTETGALEYVAAPPES